MKTHIPATLRKALIAALFAVSAAAYNAQAAPVDIVNSSEGYAETGGLGYKKTSTGYADLIFSGTNEILGTVDHWCHDGDTFSVEHRRGGDTYITLDPGASGKYVARSIVASRGKDDNSTIVYPYHECSDLGAEFGYSQSWSNGNINVQNETVLEVTASITANGAININGASRVTAGNKVTAGEINLTGASLTAGVVSGSRNELWVPGGDSVDSSGNINVTNGAVLDATNIDTRTTITVSGASRVTASGKVAGGEIIVTNSSVTAGDITVSKNTITVPGGDSYDTTGKMTITGSDAVVTATGTVKAAGGVDVSSGAHLNASNINSTVGGNTGYVRALPGENLKVTLVASEKTQYIVDNGCTITLGGIGVYDEENKVMHGNGNYFGYGEDSNNIKADAIYVLGDIISDNNELVALGNAVYDHEVDPDSSAIYVKGSITGKGNELFVRNQDAAGIWVAKDISGDNNSLITNSGDIHVAGTLGRSKDSDEGAAKGNSITAGDDITIHQLADNENLTIDAMNGELTIEDASEATLLDSSITAAEDVVIAANAEGSNAKLNLINTDVTSEDGDITANQVLVMENGTLSAENGNVTAVGLNGKAASVHAIDLEAGYINLHAGTSSTADIVLTGDMTSTKGTMIITNYNGADPRVTVDGTQQAERAIDITNSNVAVGKDQKSEAGDISVAGSTLTVGGNQEAAKTIGVYSSTVDIAGDEKAGTRLGVHGSTLTVGGDQTAGTSMAIDSGSKVTVGHEDEETGEHVGGNQTAKMNITIEDSEVTVLADQTSTEQSIVIRDLDDSKIPTKVTVNGDQKAKESITASGAELTVGIIEEIEDELTGEITYELAGGNQTAETGDITIDNSTVDILGHQDATEGSIYVTGGSDLTVGAVDPNGEVVQASNQTAQQDIKILDSKVAVLGDQEATEGEIVISADPEGVPSLVYVGGDQKAGTDITLTTALTAVKGDQTAGGSIAATDTMTLVNGDQTAAEDITVIDSIMSVGGDQTATAGAIAISSTGAEDMTLSEVIIGGNQEAGTDISVTDSTLTVGTIETIEDEETGEITYELVGGNQTADAGDISIANSTVDILGNQEATAGSIGVFNSELTVGAVDADGKVIQASKQTAHQDIEIVNSEVTVLGDQIAEQGRIAIQSIGEDVTTPSEVIIGGDQAAYMNIYVADSTLTVGTIETIEDEATGEITYKLAGGNQTADTRDIGLANSTVEILGHQKATEASISVFNSTLTVGAVDPNGEVLQASNQTAKQNIVIADSEVNVLGDQTAETGAIAISSIPETGITSVASVGGNQKAGNGIFVTASELTVGTAELVTDETTGEKHVVLTGGNQTALNDDIVISNSTVEVLADQTAVEGGIKIDKLSLVAVGTIDTDGQAVAGNQLAKRDIEIDSSTLMVMENQTSQEGSINVQTSDDFSLVIVGGTQTAKKNISIFGSKEYEEPTTVMVGEDQIAQEGNIAINDAQVYVQGKVVALGDGTDGTGIVALAGASYDVDISLQAKELNIGTIDNPSAVTINVESLDADGKPLDTVLDVDKLTVAEGNTLHTGNVKMDAADVTIKGIVEAGVKDYDDPTNDIAADWKVTGSHDISGADAHLMANGDIEIVATEEGDAIRIADGAKVSATGNVTIQGLAAALAEVDNATVRATGDIIFDRAELKNNHDTDIATKGGDIVLKNRVEISDTMLNVLPTEEGKEGVINVAEGADVQLYQGTVDVFNGALAGTGSVTANDENLVISHDSPGFNGTINMVRDNEQTLYIGSKGVGDKAVLSMQKGSSLATRIGGQDANLGNVVTTDGSFIQMNAVDKGNRTTATSLNLTAGTTYELFATTDDTTGALLADTITVSNGINANGARVRAHSDTPLESLADGSRFTIAGGSVVSGFNEDVLYDMVQPDAGSKRTARALQTRNMHLEHTAHGVDLVVSENYKAIDDRNTNAAAVRDVILPLDAAADHRPGKLAGSASQLDHVLDALDYTRSGADAREGLLSLSGAANLIVPNMMMDASRHHLSALRDHMSAPVCNKDRKTKGNVWAAYTGGYDHIGGDENMHAYSHSYQGALVGGDYAVNCNWAVGLSLGYQKSIARTVGTRADADAISGDLYAVGRTGKYTHRFSMGLTSYSTDVKRGTRIAAAGHTYHGQSTGSADGMSWNFGYQLSRNFAINQVSTITPYLTVDVALQRIDTLNEKGQGDASVVTDYEDFVQTDAALGVAYSHTFTSFNRQAGVVSVNLAAHGEFSEHRATAKNHFAGYADTWKTRSMKRAPFYGELGADVVVPFGEHISGTAGVNFEFSADRTFVGGHAGVNYRF